MRKEGKKESLEGGKLPSLCTSPTFGSSYNSGGSFQSPGEDGAEAGRERGTCPLNFFCPFLLDIPGESVGGMASFSLLSPSIRP